MSRRRLFWSAASTRRTVQAVFLLLFLGLVVVARPVPETQPSLLLKSFFWIDPLIMVATWLAAHAVPAAALLSLVVVVGTLVLGRVFCGWVCPLGTVHAMAGRFFDRWWPKSKRRDHSSPWQLTKYYLLVGLLVMAVFGVHWVCVWDPIVLFYRSTTVALMPAVQWAVEEGSTAIYQADPGIGPVHVTGVTEPVYEFMRDHVFVVPQQAFLGSWLILVFFVMIVLANGYRRRFWCRYLCPLGALLGILARWPMLRRTVSEDACNQCDLCAKGCHGAASEAAGSRWKPSECFGCLNCTGACSRGAIDFRWTWPWRRQPAAGSIDLSKRAVLGAMLGGLIGLPLMRAGRQSRGGTFHPKLIRPPGSRGEREFLKRCTACGLCMKICPTGGLQPVLTEAGLEGLWTPRLVPRIGYCDYTCNLCGQVCPTEAITPLSVEAKQQVKIGLASFDTTRCIPYAYGRDCMVCEEHCPIPDKAIYFLEIEVQDHDGNRKQIKQPHVDPGRCIGCGVCESVCPLKDRPGVSVFSANETRNPDNQPILPEQDPY